MVYDPFARGQHPVGVRTLKVLATPERELETELWYPADAAIAGDDLDPRTQDGFEVMPGLAVKQSAVRDAPAEVGQFPAVLFSHGHGSHRRSSNFLCTHLASHGYLVVAADHAGNTTSDLIQIVLGKRTGDPAAYMAEVMANRPRDVQALAGALRELPDLSTLWNGNVGLLGHSLGGWTILVAAGAVPAGAVVAMCSSGGPDSRVGSLLENAIDFAWSETVPTLFLASEMDAIVPLASTQQLFGNARGAKQMLVLDRAGHFHVCDAAGQVHEWFRTLDTSAFLPHGDMTPFQDLCSAEHGRLFAQGATLHHFDVALGGNDEARALTDLDAELERRGIQHNRL